MFMRTHTFALVALLVPAAGMTACGASDGGTSGREPVVDGRDGTTEPSPGGGVTSPGSNGTTTAPGPSASGPAAPSAPNVPGNTNVPVTKTLKILSYNVAGLPEGLSSSSPAQNTSQISPKLNPWDLVAVQEDFSYHAQLIAQATHPYKTPPMSAPSPTDLGDGLNALSRFAFSNLTRTTWTSCSGYIDQKNDCLTSKGFAAFTLDVGGALVDVYDAHFDAGRSDNDAKARAKQVTQLVAAINARSGAPGAANGHAVIVLGDTNMKASDETTLQSLLTGAKLDCACRVLTCAEPDRIDRVMFRSSSGVKISSSSWHVETSFVDAQGKPLSDHEPVSVELSLSF